MKQEKDCPSEKEVYKFMLEFAQEILDEPDIVKMGFCRHTYEYDYALMLIEGENETKDGVKKIYRLYACDKNGEHHFGTPFTSGSINDIIAYLKDKDNVDVVMLSTYKNH